jgi:dynein heavy chain
MYCSKKYTDIRCSHVFFRSFDIVPEPVIVVCECVAIIGGYTEVDWEVAKEMMADPNFLQNLQEVNCDLITGTQIRAIKTHLKVT